MESQEIKVNDVSDEQLKFHRFHARNLKGLTGRLFINDVQIHEFSPETSQLSCNDIQNWLMPGENSIVLSITKGPVDSLEDGLPLYECSLHGAPETQIPDERNCLWSLEIKELSSEPPCTLNYTFQFTSLQVPTSQLWRDAQVVDHLDDKDRQRIVGLQHQLVSAFKTADTDQVMNIYNFVLSDEALMLDVDSVLSNEQVKQEVEFIGDMAKQGAVSIDEAEDVYFNHLVGNRVVQLCSESGGPTIAMRDDEGEEIYLNIYASKLNGEWNLVRR
jgi:hypothetical protein